MREQIATAPIRSGASVMQKPRGKLNPGMAAVREGPNSTSSNINTNTIPICNAIMSWRLMYYWNILQMDETELVKKVSSVKHPAEKL